MKIILLLLCFVSIRCIAQYFNSNVRWWECQYVMLDSNKKIMKSDGQGFATIEFYNEVSVSISTMCNSGGASIRFAEKDSLFISDIMSTALMCDKDKMYWEDLFLKYFRIVENYELNKTELKLFFNNKKEYLFFTAH